MTPSPPRLWSVSIVGRRLLAPGLALCLVAVSAGCRTAREAQAPLPDAGGSAAPKDAGDDERSDQAGEQRDGSGGDFADAETGVQLTFPDGWTLQAGEGELLLSARGPGEGGLSVGMRRWDSDVASLEASTGELALAHLSSGPASGLEELADGPPLVLSTPVADTDGMLRYGWFIAVMGRGLAIEARIPAADFEEGWRQVDAILRSASRVAGARR